MDIEAILEKICEINEQVQALSAEVFALEAIVCKELGKQASD